jgi:hypothetical protein
MSNARIQTVCQINGQVKENSRNLRVRTTEDVLEAPLSLLRLSGNARDCGVLGSIE